MHLNLPEFHLLFFKKKTTRRIFIYYFGFALPFVSLVDSDKHKKLKWNDCLNRGFYTALLPSYPSEIVTWVLGLLLFEVSFAEYTLKMCAILHLKLFQHVQMQFWNVHLTIACLMRFFSIFFLDYWLQFSVRSEFNSLCHNSNDQV